jgi:hypothetical protein
MSKANSVGELFNEGLIYDAEITGTTPFVIYSPTMYHLDGICFQAVTSAYQRVITANGTTDHVVSSTKTWTFAGGAFTAADVGATFVIAHSVADNGTYTIASVTNGTTIVSTEAVASDETFTANVTMTLSGGVDLHYTFSDISVSNNYVPAKLPGLNQIPYAGDWAAVKAKFADTGSPFFPAIAAVTANGTAWYQMYPFVGRVVRWTITPTSGQSRFKFWIAAKGNR